MQNLWSKEDLANFNDSEVFKELEERILDTVKRASILNKKIIASQEAVKSLKAIEEQAKKTTEALSNLAEDPEEGAKDASEEDLTEDVLGELRLLAQEAIEKRDIKLAYKIERTIDEILEQEVACK